MTNKKRILITGAAGFMGSHLLDYLIDKGHDVIGIDNYSLGSYAHKSIAKIDLLDKKLVDDCFKETRPQIVYHLAAWAHEGLSQFSPIKITENNYNAYLNTLIPAIKYKSERVVLTSSMSVYGNQEAPFYETMRREPCDIYGLAKTSMEVATEILSKVHGFQYNIVRPHNVYGPRQNMADPYRNVVAIFINSCLRNKRFYIYGNGKQTRAFSYVDDVTPYIAELGFTKYVNHIFNVGPDKSYSINELAEYVLENFPEYKMKPFNMDDRPLEVKEAYCTNEKIKRFLDYKTRTPLKEGVRKMCTWAKKEGGKEPIYLDHLEIERNAPITWRDKLI